MYVYILPYEHFINACVDTCLCVLLRYVCTPIYYQTQIFCFIFFVLKSNIIAIFIPSVHNRAQLSLVEIQLTLDIVEMFLSLEVIIQSWEVTPRNPELMEDEAQENEMEDTSILCLAHHHSVCEVIWQIQSVMEDEWVMMQRSGLKLAEKDQDKLQALFLFFLKQLSFLLVPHTLSSFIFYFPISRAKHFFFKLG